MWYAQQNWVGSGKSIKLIGIFNVPFLQAKFCKKKQKKKKRNFVLRKRKKEASTSCGCKADSLLSFGPSSTHASHAVTGRLRGVIDAPLSVAPSSPPPPFSLPSIHHGGWCNCGCVGLAEGASIHLLNNKQSRGRMALLSPVNLHL